MPTRFDRRRLATSALAIAVLTTLSGCGWFRRGEDRVIEPQPTPDVYRSPLKADAARTGDYNRTGLLNQRSATRAATTQDAGQRPSVPQPAVPTPLTASTQVSAAMPEYLVLGSVVANVNGSPIYANELLQLTAPLLRARARETNETAFRQIATTELKRQRDRLIGDELEYAAAQRNTTPDEAREAQSRTFLARERMISQAGGSLEMARALAREQGTDLEQMLRLEERRNLVGIYYRKRVFPRVSLTVDEMRRYYEQNRERRFTRPATATMRVVRVDIPSADAGGEAAARQRAEDARRRIASGEDFEAISNDFNQNAFLREQKGLVGPVSRGAYVIGELDEAAWQTPVGQATPVVRSGNAFYVARVVERTEGGVRGFDDPEVQQEIQASLRESKILEITEQRRNALTRDAVIQADEKMLEPAVEMAMQLYPTWRAGGR